MDSTILSYIVIGILVLEYSVDTVLNYLNAKKFQDPIPPELEDVSAFYLLLFLWYLP